ncbi:MAG: NAD(P)(+) transhydrogenase (Re/Si-specific) subunit beta, partial [Alphaproteobacteria bacterium]
MTVSLISFVYLISAVLFILSLKSLSSPQTARRGNFYGISAMALAVLTTILSPAISSKLMIISGIAT